MLRKHPYAVAVCDSCGTTASDAAGVIVHFFDEGDALEAVTSEGGPDGAGAWEVLPTLELYCSACHPRLICAYVGHRWGEEHQCMCVDGYLSGGCGERAKVCRRCREVRTTHQHDQYDGGTR
ncbi:hypothetical protein F1721_06920 [Saccharopolyspora hirsuta]|uniref:Uncharacterized protein n=1 Tax=Saccharopolyspora hirsuta TaxID=1837 RepID=A0A5M7CCE3_SACHI|nr:hypothetical protein [Saccharopolyspora hirsuta]KAA5836065.1 hypothetical protein F1721_06920 [Saccharopolyspora hirsuta]